MKIWNLKIVRSNTFVNDRIIPWHSNISSAIKDQPGMKSVTTADEKIVLEIYKR